MPKLLVRSKKKDEYARLIEAALLPGLNGIAFQPEQDCDIVFGEPDLIRDALPLLSTPKWIQATWAGVEPLLDPALRRDYILTNARGVFGGVMTEFVFGYLLYRERKIAQRLRAQQNKQWDWSQTGTLRGKTIGLLGVGSIGSSIAQAAKYFGMTVRGYTRSSESCSDVDEYYHAAADSHNGVIAFARGLDYLVSVLPNTQETRKIVDANVLASLPVHALLVNVGRGSAVDESALITALEENRIAGAVLDVFEQEPLPADHPFWTTKNLMMTFHTSAPSLPQDIVEIFVENYGRYMEGKPLKYQVDFERGY